MLSPLVRGAAKTAEDVAKSNAQPNNILINFMLTSFIKYVVILLCFGNYTEWIKNQLYLSYDYCMLRTLLQSAQDTVYFMILWSNKKYRRFIYI